MSTSVDQSFVRQFEREFHLEFQKKITNLRGFVRVKSGVIGESTTVQKIGSAGAMVSKSRHGDVPAADVDHTPIIIPLEDKYAAEDVDKLDELKVMHDERAAMVAALTASAKRQVDNFITGGFELDNTLSGIASGAMTLTKALEAFKVIGEQSAIEGGNMYAAVSFHAWAQMLGIDSFANADFVGADRIPFPTGGMGGRQWLGALWFPMNELPKTGDDRSCYYWNSTAACLAIGADETTDIWWDGKMQGHRITVKLSMGSRVVDALGVFKFLVDETTVLPT
ncbi:MAG: phage capsid protein [Geminicoccaceae bacterium]